MPWCFQVNYGMKVTSIIDCFELFIEKPGDLMSKTAMWSQYKHYTTVKYLISITPQGTVSFCQRGMVGVFQTSSSPSILDILITSIREMLY